MNDADDFTAGVVNFVAVGDEIVFLEFVFSDFYVLDSGIVGEGVKGVDDAQTIGFRNPFDV